LLGTLIDRSSKLAAILTVLQQYGVPRSMAAQLLVRATKVGGEVVGSRTIEKEIPLIITVDTSNIVVACAGAPQSPQVSNAEACHNLGAGWSWTSNRNQRTV
jgi:hypothetical protein